MCVSTIKQKKKGIKTRERKKERKLSRRVRAVVWRSIADGGPEPSPRVEHACRGGTVCAISHSPLWYSFVCLFGWLVGCLVGWLVGWLLQYFVFQENNVGDFKGR